MALRDPYRNFKFEVEIDGFTHAGFQKVTGLKQTTEVIDYREGGENETPKKLPGQTTFDAITLSRGKSDNTDFVDWAKELYNLDGRNGAQGSNEGFRRQVVIYAKDKAGARIRKWTCSECWPSEYSTGDLDASANDVLIDTLVLQNEGVKEEQL